MQNKGLTRWLWLVILTALISGCGSPAIPPTPTPLPTLTLTATPIPPTETPVPTDTPIPTFTPLPVQDLFTIADELLPVTQGTGVEEAAEYDPNDPGIHPIILIASTQQFEWIKILPEEWMPLRVSETELVVNLKFNLVFLDRNRYVFYGGRFWVGRFRTDTEVWLREAKTGKLLAYNLFVGQEPAPFSGRITSDTDFTGPPVSSSELELWLKPFVEK